MKEKSVIAKTLEISRILDENGVDLSKIRIYKRINGKIHKLLLKEITQEGININEIIEKNGLDGNFKFGMQVGNVRFAYTGKSGNPMTEEEKREAKRLRLIPPKKEKKIKKLEIQPEEEKSIVQQTLEISKILKDSGVDLSKIQIGTRKSGKQHNYLLKEIEQEGINIKEIIEQNGLNGNFRYGQNLSLLRQACNGKGSWIITEAEKEEAEELEVISREEKSAVEQIFEISKILKDEGVNLSNIVLTKKVGRKRKGKLLKEIEQDGIDINEIIKKYGLDGNFKYGRGVIQVRTAYKGEWGTPLTNEEKKKAEDLELVLNKSTAEQTLEVARILKENGVDLSRIRLREKIDGKVHNILLKEIKQEGIDINKIIEQYGLDGDFKYGGRVIELRRAYKGKWGTHLTNEEKKKAEDLELVSNKSMIVQTLKVARILKENGVDLSKIKLSKNVNKKAKFVVLKEIEQEGIDINKIIEEQGLDKDFKIGLQITTLRQVYKGNRSDKSITEEEKTEAKELGLVSDKSAIAQTLEVARILKENGVDLSKIKLSKKVNKKAKFIVLKEIEQEGIDINKIIEEQGLDKDFKIGSQIATLRKVYNGKRSDMPITEEEKTEAKELGLITEKSAAAKILEASRVLKANGVDLSRIVLTRIENGKTHYKLLTEIEQEGIDINEIIEKYGLDGNLKYGIGVIQVRSAYKGKRSCVITEYEKKEAEELGLIPSLKIKEKSKQVAKKKNAVAKALCKEYEQILSEKEGKTEPE